MFSLKTSILILAAVFSLEAFSVVPKKTCYEVVRSKFRLQGSDRPTGMLGLPGPIGRLLYTSGLDTVGKLIQTSEEELFSLGLSANAIEKIGEALKAWNQPASFSDPPVLSSIPSDLHSSSNSLQGEKSPEASSPSATPLIEGRAGSVAEPLISSQAPAEPTDSLSSPSSFPSSFPSDLNALLGASVRVLELSTRPKNVLKNKGIQTIRQLILSGEESLMSTPYFGQRSLNEIREKLAALDPRLTFDLFSNPEYKSVSEPVENVQRGSSPNSPDSSTHPQVPSSPDSPSTDFSARYRRLPERDSPPAASHQRTRDPDSKYFSVLDVPLNWLFYPALELRLKQEDIETVLDLVIQDESHVLRLFGPADLSSIEVALSNLGLRVEMSSRELRQLEKKKIPLLKQPVSVLGLNSNEKHLLESRKIFYLKDIILKTEYQMYTLLGPASFREIRGKLRELRLFLAPALDRRDSIRNSRNGFFTNGNSFMLDNVAMHFENPVLKSLRGAGINRIDDLVSRTDMEILFVVGYNSENFVEIKQKLNSLRLRLKK